MNVASIKKHKRVKTIFPIKGNNKVFVIKTMQPETTQMSLVELIKFYFVFLQNTNYQFKVIKHITITIISR